MKITRFINSNLLVIIFLTLISKTCSLYAKGELNTLDNWKFVAKFCFLSTGYLSYNFTYSLNYEYLSLSFYTYDEWGFIYKNDSMSCTDKVNNGQTYGLTYNPPWRNYRCSPSNNSLDIYCSSKNMYMHENANWWFVVLSHCLPANLTYSGVKINYEILMINGDTPLTMHFSVDQMGIFETTIAMFSIYFIALFISIVFGRILITRNLLHPTYKIFLSSIIFQFLSYLLLLIEYAQFSQTGVLTGVCNIIGPLFDYIAQTIFFLILILMAKGYTITRGALRKVTIIKIIVLFTLYSCAYIATFCYYELLFDPGMVNYFYGSPAGLALVLIKLTFGWFWFCYAIFFTLKHYPEKRKFYIGFFIFYTFWFTSGPIGILISTYALDSNIREKVAFIIQACIGCIGYLFFLVLTSPFSANSFFPFHVPTNHVGVINFPHHDKDHNFLEQINQATTNTYETNEMNEIRFTNIFRT